MWADTLQSLEQQYFLRLLVWGAASALIGILILLIFRIARIRAPLATHFGAQCAIWGAAALLWASYSYTHVPLRDYDSAASLARMLWVIMALEAGAIIVGITFASFGWAYGKRIGAIGTGVGIVVQAGALLLLDLGLVRAIQL
ncbi:MAG: DUF6992 family protein [Gemmatimonas sp.]|nr:hypothetical protein [Gemmatimonadaceae bacterium]